jgi:DUF4097 and DUF4098 domain-containing protein YvlB
VAAFVALAFGTTIRGDIVKQSWSKEFDLGESGSLVLRNDVGNVRISRSPDRRVHVEVTAPGSAVRGTRSAEEFGLQVVESGGRLHIQRAKGWREFGFWDGIFARNVEVRRDYRIQVPPGLVLDLHTANGDVVVEGVEGRLDLGTANGDIFARVSSGTVNGSTVNGKIDVELGRAEAGARMSFETVNGAIRTLLPRDLCASLDARSQNGAVRVDFPVRMSGAVRRNGVAGEINDCSGGGSLRYRSINGSIRVLAG